MPDLALRLAVAPAPRQWEYRARGQFVRAVDRFCKKDGAGAREFAANLTCNRRRNSAASPYEWLDDHPGGLLHTDFQLRHAHSEQSSLVST